MKKKFIKLVLLAFLLSLSSCEKEIEKDTLIGSYFSGFAYSNTLFGTQYDVYWSYRFIDETRIERTANENNPYGSLIGAPENYTYVYNYPSITLTDSEGEQHEGTFISKDVFRVYSINYQRQ